MDENNIKNICVKFLLGTNLKLTHEEMDTALKFVPIDYIKALLNSQRYMQLTKDQRLYLLNKILNQKNPKNYLDISYLNKCYHYELSMLIEFFINDTFIETIIKSNNQINECKLNKDTKEKLESLILLYKLK